MMAQTMTRRLSPEVSRWINDLMRRMVNYDLPPASPPRLKHEGWSYQRVELEAYEKAVEDYKRYSAEWIAEFNHLKAQFLHFYAESTPDAERLKTIYQLLQLDHTNPMLTHLRQHTAFYVSPERLRHLLTSKLAEIGRKAMNGDKEAYAVYTYFRDTHPEATYSSINPVY
jgi:hypothetical protein